jgi:hypothetical protein
MRTSRKTMNGRWIQGKTEGRRERERFERRAIYKGG